ncbi:MAG: glycosyltransferase family 39 protein [Betaproteobacteria bacterium]|nr:glycosyltransferase family 39 protein [Betaproteobacteria bacterium]
MGRGFAWGLLLAALASFFSGLALVPLFDLDEGAFSAATLEMFERGDFLATYLNGMPRYDKPILSYWLQALSAWAFGFNEFALRLASALAAVAWVLLAYRFALRLYDRETALNAAIVTATAFGVSFIGRAATADALLDATLAGALFAQFMWLKEGRARDLHIAWACMALGFLTKGPVAVAVPLLTALLYLGSRRDWRRCLDLVSNRRAWLIFAVIALPWYLAVTWVKGPGFIEGFFLKHNVGRFSGAMEGHGGGPFYYLPVLLAATLPFTGLLLPLIKKWRAHWRDDFGRYALILFGLVFVLVSASATKLPHYLLYGLSALLVLLARELREARGRWLLLPALLTFAALYFLPDLLAAKQDQAKPYYQSLLADIDHHFGQAYRVYFALAAGATALFMAWGRIADGLRLTGLAMSYGLALLLLPAVGNLLQGPVKEAGLLARHLDTTVVMDGINNPSFSVYAGRVVERRAPLPGEAVFTVTRHLAELPPYDIIYIRKDIALVRLQK